jgi:hypothetical protein
MRRFALLISLAGSACIIQAPTAESDPQTAQVQAQAQARRGPAAPPIEVKSGAVFGDKVELTSAVLNPSRGFPGESVKVALNFKVLAAIDVDYMIFVHVEDVDGKVDRINVDHAPVKGSSPTTRWKPGDMMRDEFDVPIPPSMNVRGLALVLGFWDPKTDARLPLTNPDKVRNDGRNRVFVATFPVGAQ